MRKKADTRRPAVKLSLYPRTLSDAVRIEPIWLNKPIVLHGCKLARVSRVGMVAGRVTRMPQWGRILQIIGIIRLNPMQWGFRVFVWGFLLAIKMKGRLLAANCNGVVIAIFSAILARREL
jgi:hypothetical protein